jgi:ribosomal protein S18 acetylase RimI-like enzyme
MMTAQVNTADNVFRPQAQASDLSKLSSFGPNLVGIAPDTKVETAWAEDQSRIVATLVLAFSNDPANRWMYPAPETYLRYFPDFVRALGGRAFKCGTAYFIGDVEAAALWLPPGVQPDEEALMDLFHRSLPEHTQADLLAIFEQMGSYHPDEPHWYLPLIGVDPAHQRQGYGSALLEHALRACDVDRTPAFLEASSLESIPLYQRHGFEALGTIQVGASPPITPMLRRAC